MKSVQPNRIKTITEYHRLMGLPKPEHPLVSVVDIASFAAKDIGGRDSLIFDFYCITLRRELTTMFKYGRQDCDFDEGVLFCLSPGQVWNVDFETDPKRMPSGWMILIHPDFLMNKPLAKTIRQYHYFSYSINEALYLSGKEESMIAGIVRYIEKEYHANIDRFTQNAIIAQLEVILTYTNRFYQRQFITRNVSSHQIISRVEDIIAGCFKGDALSKQVFPTAGYIADQLNISVGYLSELLKVLTGQNIQQHIYNKLIEKAKEN